MNNSGWLNAGGPATDHRAARAEGFTPPRPEPIGHAEAMLMAQMKGDRETALAMARALDARIALLELSRD